MNTTEVTKILWFSRHAMTAAQLTDLEDKFGTISITQISGTAPNVHVAFDSMPSEVGETIQFQLLGELKPLKELVQDFDEICAVLPIGLLQQLLPFCPSKRILQAKNKRELLPDGKVAFIHDGWEQITKVEIIKSDL